MENPNVMELTNAVVKDEIRKGRLVKSKDILTMLPELIDAVHIDETRLRNSVEQCLTTANPLNSLLKLFGVQLINKEAILNRLHLSCGAQDSISVQMDDSYARYWFALDLEKFRAIVEKIAEKLFELETQANQTFDDERSRGDSLFIKYENLLKEHNTLRYSAEANEKMVAERIQYILSLSIKDPDPGNEQLIELLKDLNIEVYWDSTEAPFPDEAMFTEYVVEDATLVATKPCLVRNNAVYIKGMRFIKK